MPRHSRTAISLAALLARLRVRRKTLKLAEGKRPRGRVSQSMRKAVKSKTGGRCHICGGKIEGNKWDADHVFAHSAGGLHEEDNYLPAHKLCNNYRWDYSSREFQWILKIGVWARTQIENGTPVGREMPERFAAYENQRGGRKS